MAKIKSVCGNNRKILINNEWKSGDPKFDVNKYGTAPTHKLRL